jgi:hypothetical protein
MSLKHCNHAPGGYSISRDTTSNIRWSIAKSKSVDTSRSASSPISTLSMESAMIYVRQMYD